MMARSVVKHPWDQELQLWELIFIKRDKQATIPALYGFSNAGKLVNSSEDEWVSSTGITDYRVRKSTKRFSDLNYAEWSNLPQDLKTVHPKSQEFQEKERILRSSERRPTNPVQEEAWELCQQGEHTWMIPHSEYDGAAFERTVWFDEDTVCDMRRCYFCRYVAILKDEGGAPFFPDPVQEEPELVPEPDERLPSGK